MTGTASGALRPSGAAGGRPAVAAARRPTIHDVAARAQVSKSLVSLVMRGEPSVTPWRRDAVLRAAEELGYRPNAVARSLVEQRTRALGVLISDLHNPFFAEVIDGIQAGAASADYTVLLGSGDRMPARESTVIDALLELRVEGLILLSPGLPPGALARIRSVAPVVVVGRRYRQVSGVEAVVSDDIVGVGLAVRHLIGLGHRRIAHIGGGSWAGAAERRRGYEQAMAVAGLARHVDVAEGDYTTEDGGRAAAVQLLRRPERPTAVLAVNDLAAIGALDALEQEGCRVPEDMSVVGYDNTHIARLRHIGLTSVNQPRFEMGQRALRLLFDRVSGVPGRARHLRLAPELVVRTTSGPAPNGSSPPGWTSVP